MENLLLVLPTEDKGLEKNINFFAVWSSPNCLLVLAEKQMMDVVVLASINVLVNEQKGTLGLLGNQKEHGDQFEVIGYVSLDKVKFYIYIVDSKRQKKVLQHILAAWSENSEGGR